MIECHQLVLQVSIYSTKAYRNSLTAIYGIGRNRAKSICASAKLIQVRKLKIFLTVKWKTLRNEVAKFRVEGDLRREVSMNIQTSY